MPADDRSKTICCKTFFLQMQHERKKDIHVIFDGKNHHISNRSSANLLI
jgi:hypothetical protein